MKWIVLILIIMVILIAFALWRRMQASMEGTRASRPAAPSRDAAITQAPRQDPTLATEAGVDEEIPAPASESRPTPDQPPAQSSGNRDDWWEDHDGGRPQS